MRLDDFLKNVESAHLAPTLPVKFKVIGLTKDRQPVTFDAEAQLVFVDELASMTATRAAHEKESSDDLFRTERAYQLLLVALRDKDNPAIQFASNVEQLKKALVGPVAAALMNSYQSFLAKEFPEMPTEQQAAEMEEEAAKK